MKKAKIVLSAVALFAVVGGAFAFKASKFTAGRLYTYYTTAVGGPSYCTSLHPSYNSAGQGVEIATTSQLFTSRNPNNICVGAFNGEVFSTLAAN